MSRSYMLTEENVVAQVSEIASRLTRLTDGLTGAQLNWQPDGGRAWSVGQCLDHVTITTHLYGGFIDQAVTAAPAAHARAARPDLLGRGFIWFLEPPVRIKTPAPDTAQPRSSFDLVTVTSEAQGGLAYLQALTARAMKIDAARTRFANPFAGGRRVFNVATGILVMLAHARRHLARAEQAKARPDFPSA